MGNITDKFLVVLFILHTQIDLGLQFYTHFFKGRTHFADLILRIRDDIKIKIALFDIHRSPLQLFQRLNDALVQTEKGRSADSDQNNKRQNKGFDNHIFHLMYNGFHRRQYLDNTFTAVRKSKVNLLQMIGLFTADKTTVHGEELPI